MLQNSLKMGQDKENATHCIFALYKWETHFKLSFMPYALTNTIITIALEIFFQTDI